MRVAPRCDLWDGLETATRSPPGTALGTAGGDRHSVFIDGEGRLSSCGSAATEGEEEEEEEDDEALPGLLGPTARA